MLHHQRHPPLALLVIKLDLNNPDSFNRYSILVVDINNYHFKESSEILYLQFNQVLKVYLWVKTSYHHPGSVLTGVSWLLYFKSATLLHNTATKGKLFKPRRFKHVLVQLKVVFLSLLPLYIMLCHKASETALHYTSNSYYLSALHCTSNSYFLSALHYTSNS